MKVEAAPKGGSDDPPTTEDPPEVTAVGRAAGDDARLVWLRTIHGRLPVGRSARLDLGNGHVHDFTAAELLDDDGDLARQSRAGGASTSLATYNGTGDVVAASGVLVESPLEAEVALAVHDKAGHRPTIVGRAAGSGAPIYAVWIFDPPVDLDDEGDALRTAAVRLSHTVAVRAWQCGGHRWVDVHAGHRRPLTPHRLPDEILGGTGASLDLDALVADDSWMPTAEEQSDFFLAVDREIQANARDLVEVTNEALDRLRAHNAERGLRNVLHGSALSRLRRDADDRMILEPHSENSLRDELAQAADYYQLMARGKRRPCPPPRDVPQTILSRRDEVDFPIVDAIVTAPTFAPDGTLRTEPGLHEGGRFYYDPESGFELPAVAERPTRADVDDAVATIDDEMLADFPLHPAASSRAHAFALALQPFVRALIDGPCPLHLVTSPTPGSGKNLLVDALLTPALGGRGAARMTLTGGPEEQEKRVFAKLLEAPAAILLDNVDRTLEGAALASALTADVVEGRVLGASRMARIPVRATWIATGNNLAADAEIARRAVTIRIDPGVERPDLRPPESFRHPDLLAWTRTHRADLVAALLTIARAWITEGRPAATAALGSFESWARVVGGILHHAHIDGFLQDRHDPHSTVDADERWRRHLVHTWHETHGTRAVTAADLYPIATTLDLDLGHGTEASRRTRWGHHLRRLDGQTIGPYRISRGDDHGGRATYRLADLTTLGSGT